MIRKGTTISTEVLRKTMLISVVCMVLSILLTSHSDDVNEQMIDAAYLFLLVACVFILAVGRPAPASSLIEAVSRGDTEKVQTLLAQGADVSATDNNGNTALMWAKRMGHKEIVRILKEAGAKE